MAVDISLCSGDFSRIMTHSLEETLSGQAYSKEAASGACIMHNDMQHMTAELQLELQSLSNHGTLSVASLLDITT